MRASSQLCWGGGARSPGDCGEEEDEEQLHKPKGSAHRVGPVDKDVVDGLGSGRGRTVKAALQCREVSLNGRGTTTGTRKGLYLVPYQSLVSICGGAIPHGLPLYCLPNPPSVPKTALAWLGERGAAVQKWSHTATHWDTKLPLTHTGCDANAVASRGEICNAQLETEAGCVGGNRGSSREARGPSNP